MTSAEITNALQNAVEIIPRRLYWMTLNVPRQSTNRIHYFSVDNELVYEPFFSDFGPLNLAMTYRYCKILEDKLSNPALEGFRIVHFCAHDPKKRANAALLISAYQVIAFGKSAEAAFLPFRDIYPPFLPFRDALMGMSTFQSTIKDCLEGLEMGIRLRWFDWKTFDVDSYQFFEKVEHGDMNWIIPEKFLAFAGPFPTSTDPDGYPALTPEDYVPIFRDGGIQLVIRLNKKQYDRRRFIDHGIKHVDLYFLDGTCPSKDIINKFMHITESEPGGVAVHCKAGLGRTCTLIGLFAMKHYRFPARPWIGWNRLCRPGSILGPQQQFLVDMQQEMWQLGESQRALQRPGLGVTDAERQLSERMAGLQIRDRTLEQMTEDRGQGESLIGQKRVGRNGINDPQATNGAAPKRSLQGMFSHPPQR
mmetsp:Transcript_58355/g.139121  ORF Transcript_58355/g.139121 Transcript_58355/m.139121 type:complete len:420 (+) Transcript_58355:253-1512(+)